MIDVVKRRVYVLGPSLVWFARLSLPSLDLLPVLWPPARINFRERRRVSGVHRTVSRCLSTDEKASAVAWLPTHKYARTTSCICRPADRYASRDFVFLTRLVTVNRLEGRKGARRNGFRIDHRTSMSPACEAVTHWVFGCHGFYVASKLMDGWMHACTHIPLGRSLGFIAPAPCCLAAKFTCSLISTPPRLVVFNERHTHTDTTCKQSRSADPASRVIHEKRRSRQRPKRRRDTSHLPPSGLPRTAPGHDPSISAGACSRSPANA